MTEETLLDLGERRILREIIPNYATGVGDDCAIFPAKFANIAVTTDPVPTPAAFAIAGDGDPYWMGWLLVTINASDLAASGAHPYSFVAALDLPRDYLVRDLKRLLAGIRDGCARHGLAFIGGNLRESKVMSAVGTALGGVATPLSRKGARPGDLLVVVGRGGLFWGDVFKFKNGGEIDKMSSPLFSPVAQTLPMHAIAELQLVQCAMDTSDGLVPTLEELAAQNSCRVVLDCDLLAALTDDTIPVDRPERCWLGWGDWTVVCAVDPIKLEALQAAAAANGSRADVIGHFGPGIGLLMRTKLEEIPSDRLESERFAADSWFHEGIEGYISRLTGFRLPGR